MRISLWLIMAMSLITFSYAGNINLEHKVLGGKWHKSGDLVISHQDVQSGSFEIKIEFDLDPKGIMGRIIKPFLKGEYIFNFPEEMLYERGYENLKQTGPVDLVHEDKVAILKYLKKVDIDGYQGAHKVEIRSKSTMSSRYPGGKWHMHLYYHPSVKSLGVFRSKIFYHGKAGNYDVESIEK